MMQDKKCFYQYFIFQGQRGKILQCFYDQNRVLIEGVNLFKGDRKYSKWGALESPDGIYGIEKPVDYVDVRLVDPETGENKFLELFLYRTG